MGGSNFGEGLIVLLEEMAGDGGKDLAEELFKSAGEENDLFALKWD